MIKYGGNEYLINTVGVRKKHQVGSGSGRWYLMSWRVLYKLTPYNARELIRGAL